MLELVCHVGNHSLVHKAVCLLEFLLRCSRLQGIWTMKVHLKLWHESRWHCIRVFGELPLWLRLHELHKVHVDRVLVEVLRLVMRGRICMLAFVIQRWLRLRHLWVVALVIRIRHHMATVIVAEATIAHGRRIDRLICDGWAVRHLVSGRETTLLLERGVVLRHTIWWNKCLHVSRKTFKLKCATGCTHNN